jgi:hypothetical protein
MKRAGVRSLFHKPLRPLHWAITLFLFPILFCGCFDSQASKTRLSRGNGIASLSRFFPQSQSLPEQPAADAVSDTGSPYFLQKGMAASPELALDAAESEIALPAFFGSSSSPGANVVHTGLAGGKTTTSTSRNRGLTAGDLSILNSSFSQLFTSVFGQSRGDASAQAAKEDLPNPFTEERMKREASSSKTPVEATESKTDTSAKTESEDPEGSGDKTTADSAQSAALTGGIRWEKASLILGDFDGSGRLSARAAQRSGEATFTSDDGDRGFTLYANYAALDQASSICVDDINGDGIDDLLVTNGTSLFGGVLLGDGKGGYQIADKFLTGYEPVIVGAGPFRDGRREILTVDTRTGVLKRFTVAGGYRPAQTLILSLLPEFILHLISSDASSDFLMVGLAGGAERILGWDGNNSLQITGNSLGADPASLSGSFGAYSLQVYQVGNYASVVLSSQNRRFNVANLRVTPQTFLVLGDIYGQGFVDVGVGTLSYFSPKK